MEDLPGDAPPGWGGATGPLRIAGISGIARPRRWDAVATVEAPELRGDDLRFTVLEPGRLIVAGEQPAAAARPLAAAIERTLAPPFRADAVRRGGTLWAVGAVRIAVVTQAGLDGDAAELVRARGMQTLHVDGRPRLDPVPAFERAGTAEGRDFVLRARRLVADDWDVEVSPL